VILPSRAFGVHTVDHPRPLYLAGDAMFSGSEVPDGALRSVAESGSAKRPWYAASALFCRFFRKVEFD
jgi:hypothetical protein